MRRSFHPLKDKSDRVVRRCVGSRVSGADTATSAPLGGRSMAAPVTPADPERGLPAVSDRDLATLVDVLCQSLGINSMRVASKVMSGVDARKLWAAVIDRRAHSIHMAAPDAQTVMRVGTLPSRSSAPETMGATLAGGRSTIGQRHAGSTLGSDAPTYVGDDAPQKTPSHRCNPAQTRLAPLASGLGVGTRPVAKEGHRDGAVAVS